MKERPVLMTGAMVRASMREVDPKEQTRRVIKLPPAPDHLGEWEPFMFGGKDCRDSKGNEISGRWTISHSRTGAVIGCPHGGIGEHLWVRETFQIDAPRDGTWHDVQWYGCKGSLVAEIPQRFQHPRFCNYKADWLHGDIRWRPGIHMPRWASRLTLEITDVRVERLQDISEADAIAEGLIRVRGPHGSTMWEYSDTAGGQFADPRVAYHMLWDSINGNGSWDLNPWVWVIAFRRLP